MIPGYLHLSGILNLSKYFKLINLRSIKIPEVREFNFWSEEEEKEDEEKEEDERSFVYIFPRTW